MSKIEIQNIQFATTNPVDVVKRIVDFYGVKKLRYNGREHEQFPDFVKDPFSGDVVEIYPQNQENLSIFMDWQGGSRWVVVIMQSNPFKCYDQGLWKSQEGLVRTVLNKDGEVIHNTFTSTK